MIGNLWTALGQKRPFQVTTSTSRFKSACKAARQNARAFGCHYGFFFTTTGCAWGERINPTAQYEYFFRTDRREKKKAHQ